MSLSLSSSSNAPPLARALSLAQRRARVAESTLSSVEVALGSSLQTVLARIEVLFPDDEERERALRLLLECVAPVILVVNDVDSPPSSSSPSSSSSVASLSPASMTLPLSSSVLCSLIDDESHREVLQAYFDRVFVSSSDVPPPNPSTSWSVLTEAENFTHIVPYEQLLKGCVGLEVKLVQAHARIAQLEAEAAAHTSSKSCSEDDDEDDHDVERKLQLASRRRDSHSSVASTDVGNAAGMSVFQLLTQLFRLLLTGKTLRMVLLGVGILCQRFWWRLFTTRRRKVLG